ncbi:hypothetical protein AKJ48_02875, partial [candidate division MSBL1 archaeon SCGC-AAA261O19]
IFCGSHSGCCSRDLVLYTGKLMLLTLLSALHGLEGGKDKGKWPLVASKFAEAGYASLRFNFRGCGRGGEKSEGKFEDTTLSARIRDYKSSLNFLQSLKWIDVDRIGVIGSSLGGMVAISGRDERVKTIVTMSSPYKVPRYGEPRIPEKRGDYYILPSGRRFKEDFYEDIRGYDLLEDVKEAPPLLIIHGTSDEIVPPEHAQTLYDHAGKPKRVEMIKGADHAFSESRHLEKALQISIDWFERYL